MIRTFIVLSLALCALSTDAETFKESRQYLIGEVTSCNAKACCCPQPNSVFTTTESEEGVLEFTMKMAGEYCMTIDKLDWIALKSSEGTYIPPSWNFEVKKSSNSLVIRNINYPRCSFTAFSIQRH